MGSNVGSAVGSDVGAAVGSTVGANVGAAVSATVSWVGVNVSNAASVDSSRASVEICAASNGAVNAGTCGAGALLWALF